MSKEILMEKMTWKEIKSAIANGKNTVIVMAGSIEQHGPHLPTGTDTIAGYVIAERLAKKLKNALVAPVIRPGVSKHHMGFPGTISISPQLFMKTIEEYCYCLADSGFKSIVVLASHGGNYSSIAKVVPKVSKKLSKKKVKVITLGDLNQMVKEQDETVKKFGVSPEIGGLHSGYTETSFMLAIKPKVVRMSKAEKGFVRPVSPKLAKKLLKYGLKRVTKNGVLGDPRNANKKVGQELLKGVDYQAKEIKRLLYRT